MQRQNLSRGWRFKITDASGFRWEKPDYSSWRLLVLPHHWSIELPRDAKNITGSAGGYFTMGTASYQKTLTPTDDWRGKKIFVEFEGVYMNAEVYLDNHFITRHPYGYTTFQVDLTPYIDFTRPNSLRVLVDNSHLPNSRWYSGSGIYRPVWLIVADAVHVAQWGVSVTTPQTSVESANVRVAVEVENESAG